MDQARWIIVFSVVICMVATLTLLQKFSPKSLVIVETSEVAVESPVSVTRPVDNSVFAGESINYGQIRYPEPPSHVYSVGNAAEIAKEAEMMNDDGKIIE